ncbi:CRISPR-associated endonuclease/helicase Cas3 [Methanothermobacter sp. EMTCatA1]|nr:CRISPR-associated endonuclease/helicase Cas3 [Methanothermobacter sp. EMTCatA1]
MMLMMNLKEFVSDHRARFEELYDTDPSFFEENLIAKTNDEKSFTLEGHTRGALESLRKFLNENTETFDSFAKRHKIEKQLLLDVLFFAVFFHDIGKGTLEFYNDKILKKQKSYHPLYSVYFTYNLEMPKIGDVDYITLSILTHHTLLHDDIYSDERFAELEPPTFFKETLKFAKEYKRYYKEFFNRPCPYEFKFELPSKKPYNLLRDTFSWSSWGEGIIDNLNTMLSQATPSKKKEVKEIYGFITGNLIRADWFSSGSYELDAELISKDELIDKIRARANLRGHEFHGLKRFQEVSSKSSDNIFIKIPTGEGKTEAALLWALNNLKNRHTKIIYTMPTQVTSNSMYKRLKDYFGKDKVGILHGSSSIILAEEYNDDQEKIWKEKIINKTFSKPITVSTLDSFLLSFFNVYKWPLSQLNVENCLLIVDEVHSYDWQMMGVLKRILCELNNRGCKFAIMSATFPVNVENILLEDLDYNMITEEGLFEHRPFSLKAENSSILDKIDSIINKFNNNKKVLVVLNTVNKAKEVYRALEESGSFKTSDSFDRDSNLILYHSQFTKAHRKQKESEIELKEKWKNRGLVVVATQVVEISLDIDFDVLFTEIAPIDAITQRLGRINRSKDPHKKGEVYIETCIEAENGNGRWVYPYGREVIECSKNIIEDGEPSLGEMSEMVFNLYTSLLEIESINLSFNKKLERGYNKYDEIINKRGPYTIRFRTENMEEVSRLLSIRDVDERFEKIDVVPAAFFDEEDPDKFENTVGIYKWLFLKMLREGKVDDMKRFYLIHGVNYSYAYGFEVSEGELWNII